MKLQCSNSGASKRKKKKDKQMFRMGNGDDGANQIYPHVVVVVFFELAFGIFSLFMKNHLSNAIIRKL